jgi:hypothetical protein
MLGFAYFASRDDIVRDCEFSIQVNSGTMIEVQRNLACEPAAEGHAKD